MSTCTDGVGSSAIDATNLPRDICTVRFSRCLQPCCSDKRNLHFPWPPPSLFQGPLEISQERLFLKHCWKMVDVSK